MIKSKKVEKISTRAIRFMLFIMLLFFAFIVFESGCTKARLNSVLKDDRLARTEEIQSVRIIRNGVLTTTQLDMILKKGDDIITDAESKAIIIFADGSEAIVLANSHIHILNPSILVKIGGVYIKARKKAEQMATKARGLFKVKTKHVTAGTERTEFLVTVDKDDQVIVTVFDGIVRLESETKIWSPILLGKFEEGVVRGKEIPEKKRAEEDKVNNIIRWIEKVEQITTLQVPNLIELHINEAKYKLQELGFRIGRVEKQLIEKKAANIVLSQNPQPGTLVRVGHTVHLTIAEPGVSVPNFQNMNRQNAESQLVAAGLRLGRIYEIENENYPSGTVIGQSVSAGTLVPIGAAVDFNISKVPPKCTVPNVVGMTLANAQNQLNAAGLQVYGISEVVNENYVMGTVVGQSLTAGIMVRVGSAISLTITKAPPQCQVPDVIQKRVYDAINMLTGQGFKVNPIGTGNCVWKQYPTAGTWIRCGDTVTLETGSCIH